MPLSIVGSEFPAARVYKIVLPPIPSNNYLAVTVLKFIGVVVLGVAVSVRVGVSVLLQ